MARDTRQYDPAQVIVNVNGQDMVGYAEGTFVKVAREVEAFKTISGSDGEVTRVKSQNRIGSFELTLQQSSPSNDVLSALASQDERTSDAAVPVLVKDAQGTTIAQGKKTWVKKKPDVEFSNEATNRVWVLETGVLDFDIGGEAEI